MACHHYSYHLSCSCFHYYWTSSSVILLTQTEVPCDPCPQCYPQHCCIHCPLSRWSRLSRDELSAMGAAWEKLVTCIVRYRYCRRSLHHRPGWRDNLSQSFHDLLHGASSMWRDCDHALVLWTSSELLQATVHLNSSCTAHSVFSHLKIYKSKIIIYRCVL